MKGYYIQIVSPHFNCNKESETAIDTFFEEKELLDFLKQLSEHNLIRKVDLFVQGKNEEGAVGCKNEITDLNHKARLVQITNNNFCKEKEIQFLNEFAESVLEFIEKDKEVPDFVHGNNNNGRYVAQIISRKLRIPFITSTERAVVNQKNISVDSDYSGQNPYQKFNLKRIYKDKEKYFNAFRENVSEQSKKVLGKYSFYHDRIERNFVIVPAAGGSNIFYPFYRRPSGNYNLSIECEQTRYHINSEIDQCLSNRNKPLIISMGNLHHKNFEAIIQAYGEDKELQAVANLVIFQDAKKTLTDISYNEEETLTKILLKIHNYNLYGKIALPKKRGTAAEVAEIYRLAAFKKGVLIQPSFTENRLLNIVQAAACGLPVVACCGTGYSKQISERCKNGLLINMENRADIASALKKIIADQTLWEQYSSQGVLNVNEQYLMEVYATEYVNAVRNFVVKKHKPSKTLHIRLNSKKTDAFRLPSLSPLKINFGLNS